MYGNFIELKLQPVNLCAALQRSKKIKQRNLFVGETIVNDNSNARA